MIIFVIYYEEMNFCSST